MEENTPMSEEEQLTPEEMQLLEEAMKGYGAPEEDKKHNVHTFLHQVSISPDTTKTGNLSEEELGFTKYSERSYKEMSLVSRELCNDNLWADYFGKKAEILTSTSLSKNGFLTELAVITRKQIEDVTKPKKQNKGWFKSKDETSNAQQ